MKNGDIISFGLADDQMKVYVSLKNCQLTDSGSFDGGTIGIDDDTQSKTTEEEPARTKVYSPKTREFKQ